MQKFFKSARIPFVYLENPTKLTRTRVIDEFSRVIYETSTMKPLPRGRRKKTATDTPATYKTRQKKSRDDDYDATASKSKRISKSKSATSKSQNSTASLPKSSKTTPVYEDYDEDELSDEELEKYFE